MLPVCRHKHLVNEAHSSYSFGQLFNCCRRIAHSLNMRSFGYNCSLSFARHDVVDIFVCFLALRPKSTAMVMAGRSVYLSTLLPGQA